MSGSGTPVTPGPASETTTERRKRLRAEKLAPYLDDLPAAEKQAARTLYLGPQQIFLGLGMLGFLLSLFFPHSGQVLGIDVLFYSDTARAFVTTWPERIYVWSALIGAVALTICTLLTRSALIAYLAWFFSGTGVFYSIFAVWMRQSRPPTEPGVGPSFGLVLGACSVALVFAALSTIVFRRSSFQTALAEARRDNQHSAEDKAVYELQEVLSSQNRARNAHDVFADDRRSKAAQRRRAQRDRRAAEGN